MYYANDNFVRIFGALLLIVNLVYVENFEQYSKVVKLNTTNDNGENSDGPQVHRASPLELWFPEIYKTQVNAKVETNNGRSAPTYSPSSSSTKLTGKKMASDRFLPSGTSEYNQPKDRLYDYEPHVTYPPSVPLNHQKNPVNTYLKAPAGPITDDDKTDSYIGPVSPQLLPPTNTKGNRKDDVTDNKSDIKDSDDYNDANDDDYNDDDMTTEMNESDEPPPPPPPPTRGVAMGTARVAKYSYYYLARTVWYVPLYALLYYTFYVAYLVIKSITRHKITAPTPTVRIQRSLRDLTHKEAVQKIDKLTVFVMNQIEDFKDKYL